MMGNCIWVQYNCINFELAENEYPVDGHKLFTSYQPLTPATQIYFQVGKMGTSLV